MRLPDLGRLSLSGGGARRDEPLTLDELDSAETGAPVPGAWHLYNADTDCAVMWPRLGQPRTVDTIKAFGQTGDLYAGSGRFHKDVMHTALRAIMNNDMIAVQGVPRPIVLGETVIASPVVGLNHSQNEIFIFSVKVGTMGDAEFYQESLVPDLHALAHHPPGTNVEDLPPLYQWSGNCTEYCKSKITRPDGTEHPNRNNPYAWLLRRPNAKRITLFGRASSNESLSCYGRAQVVGIEYRPSVGTYNAAASTVIDSERKMDAQYKKVSNLQAEVESMGPFGEDLSDEHRKKVEALNKEKDRLGKAVEANAKAERDYNTTKAKFEANRLIEPFITFRLTNTTLRIATQNNHLPRTADAMAAQTLRDKIAAARGGIFRSHDPPPQGDCR